MLLQAVDDKLYLFPAWPIEWDVDFRVTDWNPAAEKIFGYSQEEVLGHDLDIVIDSRCSRNHRLAVERYIETRESKLIGNTTEILATRKDGELFPA